MTSREVVTWCREQAEIVYDLAAEYAEQGDDDIAEGYYGQAAAFREVARHIEYEESYV